MSEKHPIAFIDLGMHATDDPDCPECAEGYPRKCACGGLIHADEYFMACDWDCGVCVEMGDGEPDDAALESSHE